MEKFNKVLAELDKSFGKGKVISLGGQLRVDHPVIKTGSLKLSRGLSGGYPRGRIVEIFGEEGSGKTTLALHAIAEAQKEGIDCAFIDMEHAFNRDYAEKIGVDTDNLLFTQPDFGEEALMITEKLSSSKEIGLIIVDSVAALIPKSELEGEIGESKMGLQARMMSQAMRKIVGNANKNNCTIIFINQIREKIGVMFGDPTTTPGGNALKFAASQRLRTSVASKLKDGDVVYGNIMRINVIKNKIGVPHRKVELNLIYGWGLHYLTELVELCTFEGIINKAGGGWYSYGEVKFGQGIDKVLAILEDNPELQAELETKLENSQKED